MDQPSNIVCLAGGVGAARFLRGLVNVTPPSKITVIVNTGDDREFYGVHVSPDLDIVTYTLAGLVDNERGFGLKGDTFKVIDSLRTLGHEDWFRLGDRDFATCIHRTLELRRGTPLSLITHHLCRHLGVKSSIIPMSDDPCPTFITLDDGQRIHFEEYLIKLGAPNNVAGVDLSLAQKTQAAPGVFEALAAADAVIICPSNPVVSIGPILAIPGIRSALNKTTAPIVAISPLVGGKPVKGPAHQLLRGVNVNVSASGVASLYQDFASGFLIDTLDIEEEAAVQALGYKTLTLDTLMIDETRSTEVADAAIGLARSIG